MMRRTLAAAVALAAVALCQQSIGEAHKPITSPYTFTEHTEPIFRRHCASCHAPGNVAPMSLLTHADAAPWAESIRLELMAGHMPPWGTVAPAARFRGTTMTAGELNTLMVWAAGGTPPGAAAPTAVVRVPAQEWRLGPPDAILTPSAPITIPASVQEHVETFTLPTDFGRDRLLRAIDLLPGEPSVVRAASIAVSIPAGAAPRAAAPETLLSLWLPGDEPTQLDAGAGLMLPAGASVTVRVRYRKTWRNEREEIRDRPSVGLYFAREPAAPLQAWAIGSNESAAADRATFTQTVERDFVLMAVYADPSLSGVRATVYAQQPGAVRERLLAVQPRHGWSKRYWLREGMTLARGTTVEVTIEPDGEGALLPPGVTATSAPDTPHMRLTMNGLLR